MDARGDPAAAEFTGTAKPDCTGGGTGALQQYQRCRKATDKAVCSSGADYNG